MKFDTGTEKPIVRFDPYTGEALYPPEQTTDNADFPKPKKKKAGKIILGIVAGMLVIGGIVFLAGSLLAGNTGKVLFALQNTLQEKSKLAEAFDREDIWNSKEFTLGMSTSSYELNLRNGEQGKQLDGNVGKKNMASVEFVSRFTDQELLIQVPNMSDKLFVYDYKHENDGFLADVIDTDSVNKVLEYLYEFEPSNINSEKLKVAVMKELMNLEFEKVSKEKFEIGGKDRTCKGYITTITEDHFDRILGVWEETVGNQYRAIENIMPDLAGRNIMLALFDRIREKLDDMPDLDLTVYIYKKKLACIQIEIEDQEKFQIRFRGGKMRTEEICLVDESEEEIMEFTREFGNPVEMTELRVGGEKVMSFDYDSENGDFEADVMKMKTAGTIESEKDGIYISVDQMESADDDIGVKRSFYIEKGAELEELSGERFDIGNASKIEFKKLIIF